MNQGYKCLKRLANEEDEATALSLADALCQDNVEKFLQLYDEIPATVSRERVSNIKEMARQLAALTRNSNYRHGPMPGKDSSYFPINHTLQTTQLTLAHGTLGSTDFSVFMTPPEGCTPVDSKHFDYEDETLRMLGSDSVNNLSLATLCDDNDHLNDSGVLQMDTSLSDLPELGETLKNGKYCKMYDADVTKADDDAFHTPPEFQDNTIDPPFGYPPSSDQLITSAINLLSNMSTENSEGQSEHENSTDNTKEVTGQNESENPGHLIEELTCSGIEKVNSEKGSSDGSPRSRNSFVQEEDDSGISTVEENDVSQDSPVATNDNNSGDIEKAEDKSNHRVYSKSSNSISEKRTYSSSSPSEPKFPCSNFHDTEDAGVGWQTRYKRIGRKPNLKNDRRSNFCDRDGYGQNERCDSPDIPQRGVREGKIKERNTKMEKNKRTGNRYPEDSERNREINAWTNKKNEDNEICEPNSAANTKRSGRHGGSPSYGGRKSEGRWGKNSSREKQGEEEINRSQEQASEYNNSSSTTKPSVFSYRDALLKAGNKGSNPKDGVLQQFCTPKAERVVFDFHSAANYLSSEWMIVNNLRRRDPSKVFVYSDD